MMIDAMRVHNATQIAARGSLIAFCADTSPEMQLTLRWLLKRDGVGRDDLPDAMGLTVVKAGVKGRAASRTPWSLHTNPA